MQSSLLVTATSQPGRCPHDGERAGESGRVLGVTPLFGCRKPEHGSVRNSETPS